MTLAGKPVAQSPFYLSVVPPICPRTLIALRNGTCSCPPGLLVGADGTCSAATLSVRVGLTRQARSTQRQWPATRSLLKRGSFITGCETKGAHSSDDAALHSVE